MPERWTLRITAPFSGSGTSNFLIAILPGLSITAADEMSTQTLTFEAISMACARNLAASGTPTLGDTNGSSCSIDMTRA